MYSAITTLTFRLRLTAHTEAECRVTPSRVMVSKMDLSKDLRSTGPVNFFGRPFFPVFGPLYRYFRRTSSLRRLITLKPSVLAPVTKVSLEKKASATRQLDNLRRSSLRECM